MPQRPIVLITGASRRIGIGSSIAQELARSGWDEFGQQFQGEFGTGQILSMTSDHTAGNLPSGNLPYGARWCE